MRLGLLTLLVITSACEQWKAPRRVQALEKRVAELTDKVDELSAAVEGPDGASGKKGAKGRKGAKGARKAAAGARKAAAADEDDENAGEAGAEADAAAEEPEEPSADLAPAAGPPREWSYDGDTGPAKWATLNRAWSRCGKGKAQSPIDVMPVKGKSQPPTFEYKPGKVTAVDSGRGVQVKFAGGSSMQLGDELYRLVELHVHTPSEHLVAGEQYPLELQLVHQTASGRRAIVAVLYDVGAESKPLAQLLAQLPAKRGVEQALGKPFDPALLLPETRTTLRYTGSLTTPPCTEGVAWDVLRRTMTASAKQLEALRARATNARPTQPLNDRTLM